MPYQAFRKYLDTNFADILIKTPNLDINYHLSLKHVYFMKNICFCRMAETTTPELNIPSWTKCIAQCGMFCLISVCLVFWIIVVPYHVMIVVTSDDERLR